MVSGFGCFSQDGQDAATRALYSEEAWHDGSFTTDPGSWQSFDASLTIKTVSADKALTIPTTAFSSYLVIDRGIHKE